MSIPFSQCLPNSSNGIIGTNFARASTSSLSVASCEFSENFNLLCEGSNLCLKNLGEVRSVIYVPRPRHTFRIIFSQKIEIFERTVKRWFGLEILRA